MTGGPLEVRLAQKPLTVGDPLLVELRGTLPRGARLLDHAARMRDTLPDGVRILSADSLHVVNGAIVGQIRVAFFRPDSQTVPAFAIAYETPTGTDTLTSAAIRVLVQPVLPFANATLHDVHDVDAPWPLTAISVGLALVLITSLVLRWLRPRPRPMSVENVPAAEAPNAYDVALAQLHEIERATLSAEERYARSADVVRGYIAATRGVPALERTTPEILSALGANGGLASFLREADRVKFAGLRPRTDSARAREVIDALR